MRKTVFGVSDLVRHKPGCIATEDVWMLEISDLESTTYLAKTKALISCTVTVQLICTFFTYSNFRFYHDAAQIIKNL